MFDTLFFLQCITSKQDFACYDSFFTRDFRSYEQNNRYNLSFIVNAIDFQFFSRKFRRALLENPTQVPLISITDSDRALSTL